MIELTKEILENAGFKPFIECNETLVKYFKDVENKDYLEYTFTTPDGKLHISIDNGYTNLRNWNVQLDNLTHCSVGYVEIDTIEQFNKLMEFYDNDFRM